MKIEEVVGFCWIHWTTLSVGNLPCNAMAVAGGCVVNGYFPSLRQTVHQEDHPKPVYPWVQQEMVAPKVSYQLTSPLIENSYSSIISYPHLSNMLYLFYCSLLLDLYISARPCTNSWTKQISISGFSKAELRIVIFILVCSATNAYIGIQYPN